MHSDSLIWRRRRLLIVLIVMASVAFNFLIAWTCVLNSKLSAPPTVTYAEHRTRTEWAREATGFGVTTYAGGSISGNAFEQVTPPRWAWTPSPGERIQHFLTISAGWPWESVGAIAWTQDHLREEHVCRSYAHLEWGICYPGILVQRTSSAILPLAPIWPAFIANSFLYGLVLSSPLTATTLRRRLRVKRGKCARCAYPLGALEDAECCPECGEVVRKSKN